MEQANPRLADIEQALADAGELAESQRRIAANALKGSLISRIALYVIGAVLFASIFGLALPPIIMSVLGITIVGVTIVGQMFRPDVKFINAKGHVLQLRRVITTAKKELKASHEGDSAVSDPDTIFSQIDSVVGEVERNHHLDYAIMRERIVSMMPKLSKEQA